MDSRPQCGCAGDDMSPDPKILFESAVDQVRRGELRPALGTLLAVLGRDPVHAGALESAGRLARMLGSEEDARLFEAVAQAPDDVDGLYALAYRLIDQGRADVAIALLERCRAALPASLPIRRELAYARLQSQDFVGCLRDLTPLRDDPDLAEPERLDVLLMQAEAALYAGRPAVTEALLDEAEDVVPSDEQRQQLDALHGLLGRSRLVGELARADLRDWHFVQHAGVILKTAGGYFEDASRQGRFGVLALRPDMVAFLLQRMADLFSTLGLRHETVVPASETAEPMAHALAARLHARVVTELSARGDGGTLLLAANAAELSPFVRGIVRHADQLRVASINLDWQRDAPVCPEVAGVLAQRVLLPWEERYALDPASRQMRVIAADPRDARRIGADLFELMDVIPVEPGAREAFEARYLPWRAALVLGNEDVHPMRRRFTALSPLGSGGDPFAAEHALPSDDGWSEDGWDDGDGAS